jgi:hypothetical protein
MGICGSKDDEKPHKAIVSASSSDKGGSTSPSQQLAGGHAAAARPPDEVYRVFLIGDIGVGKTNLILRFCEDRFVEDDPAGVRAPIDFEYVRISTLSVVFFSFSSRLKTHSDVEIPLH